MAGKMPLRIMRHKKYYGEIYVLVVGEAYHFCVEIIRDEVTILISF